MKYKILSFFLILIGSWGLAACNSGTKGCSINGHTDFREYGKAYLADVDRNYLDSTEIRNGDFSFRHDGTPQEEPGVAIVVLVNDTDRADRMEIPVVLEPGKVELQLGEYVYITGTPLNEAVQQFLNALQLCKDSVAAGSGLSPEKVGETFSAFYKQQILANKRNALGRYIYGAYGSNLLPQDREQVKAEIGN